MINFPVVTALLNQSRKPVKIGDGLQSNFVSDCKDSDFFSCHLLGA